MGASLNTDASNINTVRNQTNEDTIEPETIHQMIPLKGAPLKCNRSCPDMMYYYSKKDRQDYIILTPHQDDSDGECYKYNFETNEWRWFTEYPNSIRPMAHSAAIDEENDILYISHGITRYSMFATLDLNTNTWTVYANNTLFKPCKKYDISNSIDNMANAMGLFLLPLRQYGVFTKKYASCYDDKKRKFVDLYGNKRKLQHSIEPKLIFVESQNILLAMGGFNFEITQYSDDISFYTINVNKTGSWQPFGINLWMKGEVYACCVVFDTILIVIADNHQTSEHSIRVLDLDDDEDNYKWMRPNISDEETYGICSIIVDMHNDIYFGSQRFQKLKRIHASKFLPKCLYFKVKRKYLLLIHGYVTKHKQEIVIPLELIEIIAMFFCNMG